MAARPTDLTIWIRTGPCFRPRGRQRGLGGSRHFNRAVHVEDRRLELVVCEIGLIVARRHSYMARDRRADQMFNSDVLYDALNPDLFVAYLQRPFQAVLVAFDALCPDDLLTASLCSQVPRASKSDPITA